MHYSLFDRAFGADTRTPMDRYVLLALVREIDPVTRTCRPTVERLRVLTGLDRRTIMRALKSLEDWGWILVSRTKSRANSYVLFPGKVSDAS